MFVTVTCGSKSDQVKILPHMKVRHVLHNVKHLHTDTNDGLYYCLVRNKKALSPDTLVDHETFLNGDTFKLVGRKPYIGYVRLSTKQQTKEYGFSHQKEMINRYVLQAGGIVVAFYEEIGSARDMSTKVRPKLNAALEVCKEHSYTLVTSKVDRLCRSVDQIVDINRLQIPFEIAELGTDQSNFMLFINASVAQEESRMISERTTKAMESIDRREKQAVDDHTRALTAGVTYWEKHPRSTLKEVVAFLARENILNPNTGKPYTYTRCYRIFGKSRREEKQDPVVSTRKLIEKSYQALYKATYRHDRSLPESIPNGCDVERTIPAWLKYVMGKKHIAVSKLSDIPLSSRLLEKIHGIVITANDIPRADANAYYKIMVCLNNAPAIRSQRTYRNR